MRVHRSGDESQLTQETGQPLSDRGDPFWRSIDAIFSVLPAVRRRQLYLLVLLLVLNALAELGTIGSVLPLLSLISDPGTSQHYPRLLLLLEHWGISSQGGLLAAATMVFCSFVVVAGGLRFQLAALTYRFGYSLAHDLAVEIQRRLLHQPYTFHVQRNTSTLVSALEKATIVVFDVILPLIQALSGGFIGLFILAALIAVDPVTALVAILVFCVIYALASGFARERLAANSSVIAKAVDERVKIVQESLGGIRDVIIDGSQAAYLACFEREDRSLGHARADTAIVSIAPRFVIETVGIVAIAIIALAASDRPGGFTAALPTLGAIALGAQRLLPLLQHVFRGWTTAAGHLSLVGQTAELLTLSLSNGQIEDSGPAMTLRQQISMNELSFTYPRRRSTVLDRISLHVPAGSSLGLTGETGSGKSTLADLLMGLLEPDEGYVSVDGIILNCDNQKSWRRSIAHVSQSIFLTDATIAQNISFSLPDEAPDRDRVIAAAKRAQLHDFIVSLPAGYDTFVGERGIRLSGGQRQRLGIARAIYKAAPVFVLDEATSALDEETESAVICALDELRKEGRTLIIIAHRLSTIRHCDVVVRLNRGRIVELGSFEQVMAPRQP